MRVPKPNIVWRGAHPNNFTVGRPSGGLDGRNTFHHIVGSAESAVLVFNNGSRGASSHLVITDRKDIAAFQCVDFKNTAWTDGNWQSNLKSITMEHHGDWRFGYTSAQVIENSARVVAWLRDQGLVSRAIRHRDVSVKPTLCPADLVVEKIWNRATEIINYYKNLSTVPEWLKNRVKTTSPARVYSHKDGVFLRNLKDPSKPFDTRRWGINQSFEIGSKTVVGGKTYYITKSSTTANAAAGLLSGEVKATAWSPPFNWVAMDNPRKMRTKTDLRVLNLDTGLSTGDVIPKGKEIDFRMKATYNNILFLRSKWSTENSKNWGIEFNNLDEVIPLPIPEPKPEEPTPNPDTPVWVDSIVDEPNRPMYVLRATPLIDLENGHPYVDPERNQEVWFEAGDIIQEISAHVIISGTTYRLTEFAFKQTEAGNWQDFANGIDSNDLTTDPKATPSGTPANPTPPEQPEDPIEEMPDVPNEPQPPTVPSSGSEYMQELLRQNNSLLKQIIDLLKSLFNR